MAASERVGVVLKFGGTSVSTLERWQTIAHILRTHKAEGVKPFVVCSAVSRVSRMLEALVEASVRGAGEPVLAEIRQRHLDLAADLGLDGEALLADAFETLSRLSLGISLIREAGPNLHARVLAMGELMLTALGAAYLNAQGLRTRWLDARQWLRSVEAPRTLSHRRYLSAVCAFDPDATLQAEVASADVDLFLTQGFIAGNPQGETVLVGWGGSDTSAAYFASKLEAERLEIWTDVPGMFTANPHQIPSARILWQLSYNEAQELASTGAEVLHPRCIDPVRRRGVPLHIRCTHAPDMEGTVIADTVQSFEAQVKALSARSDITLITMDTPGMWNQVGFLAKAFAAFERHDLSVDLVATSETNVTASLDASRISIAPETIEALLNDLNAFCKAEQIGPCAAVSLVGRNLRAILHELGPVLEALDEQHIYLVSQAASDLNFTFVVDADQAERLVRKLHAKLFNTRGADRLFGPTWNELFGGAPAAAEAPRAWWRTRRQDLLSLAEAHAPVYVYDAPTLRQTAATVQAIEAIDRVFYAMKANPNPDVLRLLYEAGLGFECVSPGELDRIYTLFPEIAPERVLFTPNFAPREEYALGFERGAFVTLDNLYPLEHWPEVFAGQRLLVRLDPGRGHGHHKYVRTAGAQSKFGVIPSELDRLRTLTETLGATVIGFHAHVGSGITREETWSETAVFLSSLAERFPHARILNVGGGLGVPEQPGAQPLDMAALTRGLALFKRAQPGYELWMEPGRFLVAQAGVLLARATQVKKKGDRHYVGLETGMNSLIRPALYGAYHEIVNLTRLDDPIAITAEIVGPICETGDVLGHGRRLPTTEGGDVFLIATAGAYGHAMRTPYNLREPAIEKTLL